MTAVEVDSEIARRAIAGNLTMDVNDAIDEALAKHAETSDDWIGGTVEGRTWDVADADDQPESED